LQPEKLSNNNKFPLNIGSVLEEFFCTFRSQDSSGTALGYGLNDRGFGSRQGLGIILFTTASRTALGPTQPI